MSDVFLSYSRDDQVTARRFAEALQREGFSVWWDQTLSAGEAYDKVTEKALEEAKAVVVLWSKTSVDSRWVRAEATTADRKGKLVPVMIEPCKRPIMFELTQTAELAKWKGDADDPAWRAFVEGLQRFTRGEAAPAIARPEARRVSWRPGLALAVLAVMAIAAGILWFMLREDGGPDRQMDSAATAVPSDVSLAVLPFANLSSDPEQEYFSDGLTEEILNQLAQVPGLRLVGRTSSFSFKGKNEDLRVIGEKLGVANLLEGSIRKDRQRLRISAKLIRSTDGSPLWSRAYERELSDIFAVQEEIAKDVAQALSVKLDVGAMSRAQGGTTNLDAYDRYLRARELALQGGREASQQAAQLLREAVALDSGFSRAWLELAGALNLVTGAGVGLSPAEAAPILREAGEAMERAIAAAPDSLGAQVVRLEQLVDQRKWSEAYALASAMVKAAPTSAGNIALGAQVSFLASTGRVEEAIAAARQRSRLEPLSLAISTDLQAILGPAGQPEAAQAEYERSKTLAGNHQRADWNALLRMLAHPDADPKAIHALLDAVLADQNLPVPFLRALRGLTDNRPAAQAVARQALEDPANQDTIRLAVITALLDALGDREATLAGLRKVAVERRFHLMLWIRYSGMQSDPQFKEILRDVGLADYFRASGKWGDFCRPVGETDFECR